MRQDQYLKLQALSERLTDVLLTEAEPDNWTGASTPMGEWTKQMRGDRYWEKKNAFATVSLINRVGDLVGKIQAASNAGAGAEEVTEGANELDAEVAAAEAEAKKHLDRVMRDTRKTAFDKHVHRGKA